MHTINQQYWFFDSYPLFFCHSYYDSRNQQAIVVVLVLQLMQKYFDGCLLGDEVSLMCHVAGGFQKKVWLVVELL
jgi:hypothetical protein